MVSPSVIAGRRLASSGKASSWRKFSSCLAEEVAQFEIIEEGLR
jgi:hypothetical protein